MPIDWSKLLVDANVMVLLEKIVATKSDTFEPSVSQDGEVVYPTVGNLGNAEVVQLLDLLASKGVLDRRSEGRVLGCPEHKGSFDLVARLRCPTCKSLLLRKGELMQHSCGFIGNVSVFSPICPNCKKPATVGGWNANLKSMGVWYECETSKERFASPSVYLYCRKFDHDFPVQSAILVDQASYKLTAEAAKELRGRLGFIIILKQGLKSAGMEVEVGGMILGASGVQHSFDLVAVKNGRKIPIDVKQESAGAIDVSGVLSAYAKALDTKSKPCVVIAIPNASEDARKSAAAYGLVLVEGADPKAIVEKLSSALVEVPA